MEYLKHYYYVTFLLGLAPYSIKNSSKSKLKWLRLLPTYAIILIAVFCILSVFWAKRAFSEISVAANLIQYIPNAFVLLFVLVSADRKRPIIEALICSIRLLDNKIKTTFSTNFNTSNIKNKRLSILAIFLVIICGSCTSVFNFLIGVSTGDVASIFYWLSFVLPKIVILSFNLQFVGFMLVLSDRLSHIIKGLNSIFTYNIHPKKIKRMDSTQNENSKPIRAVSVNFLQSFKHIEAVDSVYEIIDNIQNVCDNINLYFGKQVIFSFLAGFICLTVQMYHILDRLRYGSYNEVSDIHVAAHVSLITMHCLEFSLILINGNSIKQKWIKLAQIIHRSKKNYADEKFNLKVSELLVMIDLCKIQVNASGLFPIDLTIVTSIASSITTYLIVLIQFRISEDQNRNMTGLMSEASKATFGATK